MDASTAIAKTSSLIKAMACKAVPQSSRDDVFQDVCLRICEKIHQLKNDDAVVSWVQSVVRTTINSKYRSWRKRTVEVTFTDNQTLLDIDCDGDPAIAAIENEDRQQVRDALSRLSPTDRESLTAFYVNSEPVKDTAARLNVPLGTVKRRLHDARKNLAKAVPTAE